MNGSAATPWYKEATKSQWKTLFAAQLGWLLDAMDVMMYAFAITSIRTEFGLSGAWAGALASVTLVASAAGGLLFGALADRFGRARSLIFSMLTYSIFTALMATSHSVAEILLWRFLVGLGLGGEWAAGSVLVAESWEPKHRGKAIGLMQSGWALGYIAAALLSAYVIPAFGWRPLFVLGILPALVTIWIRRSIPEPETWKATRLGPKKSSTDVWTAIFKAPLLRTTLITCFMSSGVLFAYWGLFTWLPTFLAAPVSSGGAGLGLVKSSEWIVIVQSGAFVGYITFGFFADKFGRRPAFLGFLALAAILVPIYGQLSGHALLLFLLGPLIGYFGHGYFSVFGSMLAELFPGDVRGVAQGFTFNFGRALSALAPFTIGALADMYGIGSALAFTSVFFFIGGISIYLLPETAGKQLA